MPKECIDIQGGLNQPASDRRQKAILPRRGRIALSANERIAEFLSFAIQTKFAYVNKRGRAESARLFAWLGKFSSLLQTEKAKMENGTMGQ